MRFTPNSLTLLSAAVIGAIDQAAAVLQTDDYGLVWGVNDSFDALKDGTWAVKKVDGVDYKYLVDEDEPEEAPYLFSHEVVADPGFETEYDDFPETDEVSEDQHIERSTLSDFALCEEAVNCEVKTDEDGDRYADFIRGMEPESDWWINTWAPGIPENTTELEPADADLETRAHHCHGNRVCTEVAMKRKRINYGSKPPKKVVDGLRNHCGQIDCDVNPFGMSTAVWHTGTKSATLHVTPAGFWPKGRKGAMIDLIAKSIRSRTRKTDHAMCVANPVLGGCDQYFLTTFKASAHHAVVRYVRNGAGQLAAHSRISVSVRLEVKESIVCSAVISALTSALSGVKGSGYFGFLSELCT